MQTSLRFTAHLAVLGAGLVVAGLQGGGHVPTHPAALAAANYRPPALTVAAIPAAEVHTLSGSAPSAAGEKAVEHPHAAKPAHHGTARAAASAAATKAAPPAVRRTAPAAKPALSFQAALDAAIAQIPTYRPGAARWVVSRAYAFWGTADWYHDVLYISPLVPRSKLYDVAVHEWSHELSVLAYGGDVAAATAAMNAFFGGSGLVGAERAADCMAILQGATWTHYTNCANSTWQAGAAKLVAGNRL